MSNASVERGLPRWAFAGGSEAGQAPLYKGPSPEAGQAPLYNGPSEAGQAPLYRVRLATLGHCRLPLILYNERPSGRLAQR